MKTFRKVLGVVLAIAMLTGVFSMMASALAPDSAVDWYIETDKAVYAAGDTVTFTVYWQTVPEVGSMLIGTQAPIGYPSAVLEPLNAADDTPEGAVNFVALKEGYDASISNYVGWDALESQGLAIDAGAPWDTCCGLIIGTDSTEIGTLTDKTAIYTFQMKVKDDAPDGEYTVGFNKDCFVNYWAYSADAAMGGVYGWDDDYGYGTTANYGLNSCTFTVGAAGPVVDKSKTQLKMTPTSATTVADEFQFRVISVITDADWDAYFAQTATADETKNAITEMGMVAYKGAGTFDEATAKALVTDGTAAADYQSAGTTYVQKASDSADAYFGAIIKAKHSTFPNDVTYMGYVKYVDAAGDAQVVFYPTSYTAALASNYDNYVSAYLAANPYQG